METKKIKLFGKFFVKNNKLSIDDNLFFDLERISFVSEEMISDNPIEGNQREISFYFTFIIDGVLFEVRDNNVFNCYAYTDLKMGDLYNGIQVFRLRRTILEAVFF